MPKTLTELQKEQEQRNAAYLNGQLRAPANSATTPLNQASLTERPPGFSEGTSNYGTRIVQHLPNPGEPAERGKHHRTHDFRPHNGVQPYNGVQPEDYIRRGLSLIDTAIASQQRQLQQARQSDNNIDKRKHLTKTIRALTFLKSHYTQKMRQHWHEPIALFKNGPPTDLISALEEAGIDPNKRKSYETAFDKKHRQAKDILWGMVSDVIQIARRVDQDAEAIETGEETRNWLAEAESVHTLFQLGADYSSIYSVPHGEQPYSFVSSYISAGRLPQNLQEASTENTNMVRDGVCYRPSTFLNGPGNGNYVHQTLHKAGANGQLKKLHEITRHSTPAPKELLGRKDIDDQTILRITLGNIEQEVAVDAQKLIDSGEVDLADNRKDNPLVIPISYAYLLSPYLFQQLTAPSPDNEYEMLRYSVLAMDLCNQRTLQLTIRGKDGTEKIIHVKPGINIINLGVNNFRAYKFSAERMQLIPTALRGSIERMENNINAVGMYGYFRHQDSWLAEKLRGKNGVYRFANDKYTTILTSQKLIDLNNKINAQQDALNVAAVKLRATLTNQSSSSSGKKGQNGYKKAHSQLMTIKNKLSELCSKYIETRKKITDAHSRSLKKELQKQATDPNDHRLYNHIRLYEEAQDIYHDTSYYEDQHVFQLQIRYMITNQFIERLISLACKSTEDRSGRASDMTDEFYIFDSIKGHFPRLGDKEDEKLIDLIALIVHQYSASQQITDDQQPGARGLQLYEGMGYGTDQLRVSKYGLPVAQLGKEVLRSKKSATAMEKFVRVYQRLSGGLSFNKDFPVMWAGAELINQELADLFERLKVDLTNADIESLNNELSRGRALNHSQIFTKLSPETRRMMQIKGMCQWTYNALHTHGITLTSEQKNRVVGLMEIGAFNGKNLLSVLTEEQQNELLKKIDWVPKVVDKYNRLKQSGREISTSSKEQMAFRLRVIKKFKNKTLLTTSEREILLSESSSFVQSAIIDNIDTQQRMSSGSCQQLLTQLQKGPLSLMDLVAHIPESKRGKILETWKTAVFQDYDAVLARAKGKPNLANLAALERQIINRRKAMNAFTNNRQLNPAQTQLVTVELEKHLHKSVYAGLDVQERQNVQTVHELIGRIPDALLAAPQQEQQKIIHTLNPQMEPPQEGSGELTTMVRELAPQIKSILRQRSQQSPFSLERLQNQNRLMKARNILDAISLVQQYVPGCLHARKMEDITQRYRQRLIDPRSSARPLNEQEQRTLTNTSVHEEFMREFLPKEGSDLARDLESKIKPATNATVYNHGQLLQGCRMVSDENFQPNAANAEAGWIQIQPFARDAVLNKHITSGYYEGPNDLMFYYDRDNNQIRVPISSGNLRFKNESDPTKPNEFDPMKSKDYRQVLSAIAQAFQFCWGEFKITANPSNPVYQANMDELRFQAQAAYKSGATTITYWPQERRLNPQGEHMLKALQQCNLLSRNAHSEAASQAPGHRHS